MEKFKFSTSLLKFDKSEEDQDSKGNFKDFLFDIIMTDEEKDAIKERFEIEGEIVGGFVGVRYYESDGTYSVIDVYFDVDWDEDGYYVEESLTEEELSAIENLAKGFNK